MLTFKIVQTRQIMLNMYFVEKNGICMSSQIINETKFCEVEKKKMNSQILNFDCTICRKNGI